MCERPKSEEEIKQAKIEEKVLAIKKNPDEKRSTKEIRKQAEQEVDKGVEVN